MKKRSETQSFRKKILFSGGFFLLLFFIRITAFAEETPPVELYANAAVLLDGNSGRVLIGKNENTKLAMASTTKIMTCITVLEHCNLDTVVTVSAYAASSPKVHLGTRGGETYRVEDLLYSLMLESHNDSAVILAENIGALMMGVSTEDMNEKIRNHTREESLAAVECFLTLMNDKAKELGCSQTTFLTPNGLDATKETESENGSSIRIHHGTTAVELARLMRHCILLSQKKEMFLTITRTQTYSFQANGRTYLLENHNRFLQMMDGALSGKTGFTNEAGYCYVGALERNGRYFIVVLLGCGWPNHKDLKWFDTRKLMEYGLEHYQLGDFLREEKKYEEMVRKPILIPNGRGEDLWEPAYAESEIIDVEGNNEDFGFLIQEKDRLTAKCYMKTEISAPISQNTILGRIDFCINDIVLYSKEIRTKNRVEAVSFSWCVAQIFRKILIL